MRHLYVRHEQTVADPLQQERVLRTLRIILEHQEDAVCCSPFIHGPSELSLLWLTRKEVVHAFRPLSAMEVRRLLECQWLPLGVVLPKEGLTDEETRAAIICIIGGNFRLLQRLLTQMARLVEINALSYLTRDLVEAARETLVIGVG